MVLALEGAAYALFPSLLKNMLAAVKQMSDNDLRFGGLAALLIGIILVWLTI
ncbi:DUF2065 domain-containing protein [Alphaproteobacteria bacterium]|nr:DUF2065 domain-containing protein [Alphaproteobacteria bacterium]